MIRAARGPSVTLPLRYLVAATLAFVAATAGVVWLAGDLAGHYYRPRVLALAHTVALGWITLTIMGASYQLVPVALEAPIWSERVARWQFVALMTGVVGLVAHFYLAHWPGLLWAAGLVGVGVALHLVNMTLTLARVTRWSFTARLVAGAQVGLALTLLFGILLAAARAGAFWPYGLAAVHAHFHLALLGWVAPMVVGVAARLYPMFLLAPEPEGWPGWLQLGGLGAGVPALVAGLLALPALVLPAALAVAGAAVGHVAWVLRFVRHRKRPALDWGLRFVLTGTAFLPVVAGLGLGFALGWLSGPGPAVAYAVLALGGWVSLTIAGMMLKIVPFLIWNRAYAPVAGRGAVPTLARLAWPAAEGASYALVTAGVLLFAGGAAAGGAVWIRLSGVLLVAGALAFAAALGRVLAHLVGAGPRRVAPLRVPGP